MNGCFSTVWPQVGQEIEVRPGIVSKDHEGKLMCKPIFSKIVSLFAEHNDLQYAAPGGLIGKCTPKHLKPSLSLHVGLNSIQPLSRTEGRT